MASVLYRVLFELKLLHEFFLTRTNGSVIFDKTPAEKKIFLEEEFSENRSPVNTVMGFEFPAGLQQQNEGSFLRIVPSYSGCKVAVKVKELRQADGSVFYQPLVPLPANLNIFILLTRKGPLDAYTNGRVGRPYSSAYYFSNNDLVTPKTFPYLSNAIPAFDAGSTYEQGELVVDGGITREFHRGGSPGIWGDVTGAGFVNESDRLLLAPSFSYVFTERTGLTEVDFILKDFNGTEIDRQTITNAAGIARETRLNYTGKIPPRSLTAAFTTSDILYSLEVRGNNGYVRYHRIIFNRGLVDANPWGVIHITPEATNSAFNLFDGSGFLLTRLDPLGVETPPPVFEIPVKSRLLYWRFVHNRGKKLGISSTLTNYLDREDNALITKNPRRLSRAYFKIQSGVSPATEYVPNPVSYELKRSKDGLLCFDVMVAKSGLFPVIP